MQETIYHLFIYSLQFLISWDNFYHEVILDYYFLFFISNDLRIRPIDVNLNIMFSNETSRFLPWLRKFALTIQEYSRCKHQS